MQVTEIHTELDDGRQLYTIQIDGRDVLKAVDLWDCPEDASLARGLNFAYNVPSLIKAGFEAAVRGEQLVFNEIHQQDDP